MFFKNQALTIIGLDVNLKEIKCPCVFDRYLTELDAVIIVDGARMIVATNELSQ